MKKSNSHLRLIIVLGSLLILASMLLTGCSHTTKTKTGSLTGSVILVNDTGDTANNPVDYAGVTVALYKAVKFDTTLVRINSQYPNVGIPISERTEFDHRLQNPVMVTTTSADGSFQLNKVTRGNYNLAILKDGWGVRYYCDLEIVSGQNTLASAKKSSIAGRTGKSTTELYPVRTLHGFALDTYTFQSNHSYLVDNNISFVGNAVIESSAYIWVKPNMRITLLTSVNAGQITDDYSIITSADKMYETTQVPASDILRFDGIYFNPDIPVENNMIQSVITTFALNGWNVQTSNIDIKNMIFRNCGIGIHIVECDNITITQSNVILSDNLDSGGINLTGCHQTLISENVFLSNVIGIRQHTSTDANVKNCYFYNNSARDIQNIFDTTSLVERCDCAASNIAIESAGRCNTTIQYCNIQGKTGILNTVRMNWYPSHFRANNNNLHCTDYAIKSKTTWYNPEFIVNNCENNYFFETNSASIALLIWDYHNEDPNDPHYDEYKDIVDYVPYRNIAIENNGIIPN